MWAPFFASILMSLLKREPEEEKKRALGLDGQLELSIKTKLLPRPGDMLIPVQIWSDGAGIWRVIGEEDIPPLSESMNESSPGWSKISRAREDMRYFEREIKNGSSGSDIDIYVYLDDSDHGNRPSSIVLTTSPENAGPPDRARIFVSSSRRHEDKSMPRWRDFLSRWRALGTDVEHIDGPAMVPDSAIQALTQLCQGADPDKLQISDKLVRDWIEAFVELRNHLEDIENLKSEADRIEGLDEPDPDSVDEETLAQIEEEREERGYSRTLERWKEGQIEFVYDEIREKREETDDLLRREAWSAEKLMEIEGQSVSVSIRPTRNYTEITISGDDIEHTEITFHEDSSEFDVEGRRLSRNAQPGVLGSLYAAGLIETESERKKRQEEIVWKFPGDISGVWELWSLLGQFRPTGEEPMFPLIKIAFDHGLLSPAAQERFEKVLSFWNDDDLGRLMQEHQLIKD